VRAIDAPPLVLAIGVDLERRPIRARESSSNAATPQKRAVGDDSNRNPEIPQALPSIPFTVHVQGRHPVWHEDEGTHVLSPRADLLDMTGHVRSDLIQRVELPGLNRMGAAVVASLHVVILHTHMIEEKGKVDPRLLRGAYLVAFGLILHDFPEGFAMANSYVASPSLGILVALAIALRDIPEEFAMAAPAVTLREKRF